MPSLRCFLSIFPVDINVIWSVVQFPMLGTVSLEVLIACRIILGAGEGPAAPDGAFS